MLQCVVTNAAPFCPVWESCPIGLLAKVSMEGEAAKSLLCIGPKNPRTVVDFFPLDNGPAIVRSIQGIFAATPPGVGHASRPASSQSADGGPVAMLKLSAPALHLGSPSFPCPPLLSAVCL